MKRPTAHAPGRRTLTASLAVAAAACGGGGRGSVAGNAPVADAAMDPGSASDAGAGGVPGIDAETGAKDAGAADAKGFELCPGALPSSRGLTLFDLERVNFAGSTELHVVLCGPLMPGKPDKLVFSVVITDHLGIPPSDLTKPSWVVTNDGRRVDDGFVWSGTDLGIGEHHAGGLLTAPVKMADGGVLVDAWTAWMELHLAGIGDGSNPVFFRWNKEHLMAEGGSSCF